MKAIRFIGMLFAAAALSFTAISCDKDEDIDDLIDNIENGNIKPTVDLKKSSSELVLTTKFPGVYTIVETAKFSHDMCVSYVMKMTYATDKLADAAWEELKSEDDFDSNIIKRSGKTITVDLTEEMEEVTYDYMLQMFQARKDAVERGEDPFAF